LEETSKLRRCLGLAQRLRRRKPRIFLRQDNAGPLEFGQQGSAYRHAKRVRATLASGKKMLWGGLPQAQRFAAAGFGHAKERAAHRSDAHNAANRCGGLYQRQGGYTVEKIMPIACVLSHSAGLRQQLAEAISG
jgi:hypothetical protein